MVKNPPANAEHRFDPRSGKVPHASEQPSPGATATEPGLQGPGAVVTSPAPRPHALRLESNPHSPQQEPDPLRASSVLSESLRPCGLRPSRLLCPWDSPGKNTGVGRQALLQGIFPSQASNPGLSRLSHWQRGSILLSHSGSLTEPQCSQK